MNENSDGRFPFDVVPFTDDSLELVKDKERVEESVQESVKFKYTLN